MTRRITVIDFKPEHLEQIRIKESQVGELPASVRLPAVTLLLDGSPVAIFGTFEFCPGVAHLWGLVSDNVRRCPISFHKTSLKLVDFFIRTYKIRRLQIDIRDGHPELMHWARAMGFKQEGLMKRFGPTGDDYWLFGRVV